jgi:hypothetical protein
MTQDGRPSLLNDIRYFVGADQKSKSYFKNHEDVVAYGRRLALLLNSKGISLGTYSALYIQFNPTLESGCVKVTNDIDVKLSKEDWWQRYVHVGVPADFLARPDASMIAIDSTIKVLQTIRPDLTLTFSDFDKLLRLNGDKLRFLLRTHRTRNFLLEVSFNLPIWKQSTFLYLSLTKRNSGEYLEAPPFSLEFYSDAVSLSGSVKWNDDTFHVLPKKSNSSQFVADKYNISIRRHASEFALKSEQPLLSNLLKLHP